MVVLVPCVVYYVLLYFKIFCISPNGPFFGATKKVLRQKVPNLKTGLRVVLAARRRCWAKRSEHSGYVRIG